MEGLATALGNFVEEAQGLSAQFDPQVVFYIGPWGVTQYIVWLFIALAVTFAVVLVAAKKVSLVPTNKFVNTVEFGYDFVNGSIAEDVIGEGFKKHVPFLATIFFFILVCNILGLVPGFKTSTGAISCTWALAVISFVYFNLWHEDFRLLPVLQEPLPVGRSWSHEAGHLVPRALLDGHSRAYPCRPTLWQHACWPHDARYLQHRHHLLYPDCAVLWFYGPHRRPAFDRMVRPACCYVCPRVLGCFHPGVRFRDPVGFLRIHRGACALSPSRLASTAASLNRPPRVAHTHNYGVAAAPLS